ncbi:MAG: aminotransferase class V-fold PLP-dependent enzyme [Acidobacteria bacterium]|nr:aminotransferase class V-fold PLP-dependent enzyme [Acidobacteriota bacterium]
MQETIYFDNNATTRPFPEVAEAMAPFLGGHFGNPSSSHHVGRAVRQAIGDARESVAGLIGAAAADEIVFTSGGTESDNWAILGALRAMPERRHIVTTAVEHEAVRKLCDRLELDGYEVSRIGVDCEGRLDVEALLESLRPDTAVVSVMTANNETGVLFPIADIAAAVRKRSDALIHSDGVNAAGKVSIDLKQTAIDLFSISAHKFHGPKGVGALYIRSGVELPGIAVGGGQESGRRAGTEAVHQIVGMGVAARLAADLTPMQKVAELRDRLEGELLGRVPNAFRNGAAGERLPNTANISSADTNGESILALLDVAGICVSTGSACNAETQEASAVLKAMDIPYSRAMGSIRFSLGRFNTEEEVERVIAATVDAVERLRKLSGITA